MMTYITHFGSGDLPLTQEFVSEAPVAVLPRTKWLPAAPALSTALAGISWGTGGISTLTDAAWVIMVTFGAIYCLRELYVFRFRLGVGGLVLFGGAISWY